MLIQNERKLFILDTSVLLYDKACLENMQGNDIVIPLVVLEELDRFKNKEGILGENSRHFNRYFDSFKMPKQSKSYTFETKYGNFYL